MWSSVKKLSVLVFFIVFFLHPPSVLAADYYIDSQSGSDSNSGNSPSQAWQTLNPTWGKNWQPGDRILLKRGGEYSSSGKSVDNFSWDYYPRTGTQTAGFYANGKSGTSSQPITIGAYGETSQPKPVIRDDGGFGVALRNSHYWVIEDLKITDAKESGVFFIKSNYVTVQRNYLTNVGFGVYVGGNNAKILHNEVVDPAMLVADFGGDDDVGALGFGILGSDIELAYNRCVNCKGNSPDYGEDGGGFEIYAYEADVENLYIHHNIVENSDGFMEVGSQSPTLTVRNLLVAYNVSYNNGYRVLHFNIGTNYSVNVENLRFEHNTAVRTGAVYDEPVVFFTSGELTGDQLQLRDNIFYGFKHLSYRPNSIARPSNFVHERNIYKDGAGFSLGNGEAISDPQLTNVANKDFTPQSGSIAIDNGGLSTDLAGNTITRDYNDQTVPAGSAPDIGAFESGSTGAGSATPTPSPTLPVASPPVGGGTSGPIKIMPLGDSVTHGNTNYVSYRRELWKMLEAENYNVDFVGSNDQVILNQLLMQTDPPYSDFDPDHEGYWGERADQVLNKMDTILSQNIPDIALVLLGGNDQWQNQSASSTFNELKQITEKLQAANPNVTVMLGQYHPTMVDPGDNRAGLLDLNALINDYASQNSTAQSQIIPVNLADNYDYPGFNQADRVHPNEQGEEQIAKNWLAALRPVLDNAGATGGNSGSGGGDPNEPNPGGGGAPLPCHQADINEDGAVNIQDYSILSRNFFSDNPDTPRANVNSQGKVDLFDYSILSASFFTNTGQCSGGATGASSSPSPTPGTNDNNIGTDFDFTNNLPANLDLSQLNLDPAVLNMLQQYQISNTADLAPLLSNLPADQLSQYMNLDQSQIESLLQGLVGGSGFNPAIFDQSYAPYINQLYGGDTSSLLQQGLTQDQIDMVQQLIQNYQ